MKRMKILLPLIVMSLIACHKDPVSNPAWQFTASIDGKSWTATQQIFSNIIGDYIMISGLDSNGRSISLVLKGSVAGGYTMGKNSASSASYSDSLSGKPLFITDQSTDAALAGGTVVITSINSFTKTITGTFSFNAYNDSLGYKKTVTKGVISNLPFQY